jgi:predicted GH43/DUF377 family glycosyl hydrolase
MDTAQWDVDQQNQLKRKDTMQTSALNQSEQRFKSHRSTILLGLVLICGLALVLGASVSTPARATLGPLYVDGASGVDSPTCGTTGAPCASITYTLDNRAVEGDLIRISQGTYTENIHINTSLTLEGGYEAASWTRDLSSFETILDGSGSPILPGDWDGSQVRYPHIIHDGGTYKMWYIGLDAFQVGQFGYATSPDGITWTKYGGNPVLEVGAAGEWDAGTLEGGNVLKDGSMYKLWYSGQDAQGTWRIGYATSGDGISWTKYSGNPILEPGPQPWRNGLVMHPYVIKDGSMYRMWARTAGDDGSGWTDYFAYATSPDGINWTWHSANPILAKDWEEWMWRPFVLPGGTYQMWYSVWSADEGHISYATSPDGLAWTKHGSPVLSGTVGEWDESFATDPYVLFENSNYSLWYDSNTAIGLAASSDGIAWTKSAANPVLTPGAPTVWGQPVVRVDNDGAVVVLDGFTITNGAGEEAGGVHAGNAEVTLRSCLITGNIANGAPFSWGSGGVLGNGDVTIEDCAIVNNWVVQGAGGVRVGQGSLTMTNVLVADNTGDMGVHLNSPASLMNTTVVDNEGGVLINPQTSAALEMSNSIVWNNGWNINVGNAGSAEIAYSDIQGGWSGTGNIDADPLFSDPTNGDFRLQKDSPAVDAGTQVGAPDHDILGVPRPQDGDLDGTSITDMGAYEFKWFKIFLPIVIRD